MSGNPWVGQHAGKEDPRLVRISPFFYGQHKLLNILYIPKLRDLPQNAIDLKAMVFDFGFVAGQPSLGPFETQKINLQVERPLMIWGITGVSNERPDERGGVPLAGYRLQFYHTHDQTERQFFNKHLQNTEICGSGQFLHIVRHPYLIIRGDQITCEVKNLSDNHLNPNFPVRPDSDTKIQVVLWGGEFD